MFESFINLPLSFISLDCNSHWFSKPDIMGTLLRGTDVLSLGAPCEARIPHFLGDLRSQAILPVYKLSHGGCDTCLDQVCAPYLSRNGFFLCPYRNSVQLVIQVVLSSTI